MKPTEGDIKDLILYRIQRSGECLEEAKLLLEQSKVYNGAVSRMYYACFHVAVALLTSNGITAKEHNGVRAMLGLHFVKTGKLSLELSHHYGQLLNARNTGDYDVFQTFTKEQAAMYYHYSELFIEAVKNLLDVSNEVKEENQ